MLIDLNSELEKRGVNVIRTVDISMLHAKENRGYPLAILIGIALSPSYLFRLSEENSMDVSAFSEKEAEADKLAEWTADFIRLKGYKAYAQSERNLINGIYDAETKSTPLPHKKIALLAGLGWIGKNNLLVTQEYGSALCMCSVLTNAPLPMQYQPAIRPFCGKCNVCKDICPAKVIHGMNWDEGTHRDLLVDVYHCETCLKCLVHCVWTQKYVKTHGLKQKGVKKCKKGK